MIRDGYHFGSQQRHGWVAQFTMIPEQAALQTSASHRQWGPPFLLYLGDAPDDLAIKTARGLGYWRPQWCLGQFRGPNCKSSLDLPDMTFAQAKASGADTMVIGIANAGGVMGPGIERDVIAALEAGMSHPVCTNGWIPTLRSRPRQSEPEGGCSTR